MIRFVRIGLFAALLGLTTAAFSQNSSVSVEKFGISLSIVFKGAQAEITVSAPAKGWVAVGFDPSSRMKDAGFLIGYVKDGTAFARDDFGNGSFSHAEDAKLGGKNSILSFRGVEQNGATTMTFVVERDSGDAMDAKLTPGVHDVILAYSNSDSFSAVHSRVAKTTITLP